VEVEKPGDLVIAKELCHVSADYDQVQNLLTKGLVDLLAVLL
jgi:hypothetical protein